MGNEKTYPIITSQSMAVSIASLPVNLQFYVFFSIQALWTGTPTGTLLVQISNDDPNIVTPLNWSTYTGSSQSLTGSAGDFMWNFFPTGYNWARLIYTASSGSGTLNARVAAKG